MPADHLVFTLGTNFALVKVTEEKLNILNATKLQSHLHTACHFPLYIVKLVPCILQAVPLFNY